MTPLTTAPQGTLARGGRRNTHKINIVRIGLHLTGVLEKYIAMMTCMHVINTCAVHHYDNGGIPFFTNNTVPIYMYITIIIVSSVACNSIINFVESAERKSPGLDQDVS